MSASSRPLNRTEALARETQRWRDAARTWVHPSELPATREQLTAHLLGQGAPSWVLWRLNARLHASHVFASVEEIVALCGQPARRRSAPGLPYAG